MTKKLHHFDRNGHVTPNFFHCGARDIIFSLSKNEPFLFLIEDYVIPYIEKTPNTTAMVISVMHLHIFNSGSL